MSSEVIVRLRLRPIIDSGLYTIDMMFCMMSLDILASDRVCFIIDNPKTMMVDMTISLNSLVSSVFHPDVTSINVFSNSSLLLLIVVNVNLGVL